MGIFAPALTDAFSRSLPLHVPRLETNEEFIVVRAKVRPVSAITRRMPSIRPSVAWEGGSAIEASKIAGHATVNMTGDYTVVQLKRQEDLTRAIQDRRTKTRAGNPEKERQKVAIIVAA